MTDYFLLYLAQGIDDSGEFVRQYFADMVFYLTLNFIGFYFRYVGEVRSNPRYCESEVLRFHFLLESEL